jgi:DNA-directed RNA polymerase omega subunit
MYDTPASIDSKFRFVLLAACRAEQMMRGAAAKIDRPGKKPTGIAMEELNRNLVEWGLGPAESLEEAEGEDDGPAEA